MARKIKADFWNPYGSARGMRRMDMEVVLTLIAQGWEQRDGLFTSPLCYFGGNRNGRMCILYPRDLLEGSRFVRCINVDEHGRIIRLDYVLTVAELLESFREFDLRKGV
jgi:hypothetical protein